MALGDSIAAGWGASTPSNDYVSLLFAHYRSTLGVSDLSNRGVAGETSGSQRGSQLAGALSDINGPTDTRVVTIDIGANDYFVAGCPFGSAPCTDTFKNNFSQTLSDLQSALGGDPGAEIVIAMAYYNPYAGAGGNESTWDTVELGSSKLFSCSDTGAELGLNDAIAQVASAHGVLLANAYPAMHSAGQADIAGDDIHPNDLGHQAIADAFINAATPCT